MINYSIDGLPFNKDFNLTTDYNSKIVYTAICDPLFKYSINQKKYVENACQLYCSNKKSTRYKLTLRDDLFYSDGKKVIAKDYVSSINKLKKFNTILSVYFKNVLKIEAQNNKIIFYLKKPDKFFINKLSLYQICPNNEGLSSGPYEIASFKLNKILLKPNKFYRDVRKQKICYIITKNEIEHIEMFDKKLLDITNNTLYPYTNSFNEKVKMENSYIYYNIEISASIPIKVRKKIVNSIDKMLISKILGNEAKPLSSFLIDDYFENKESNEKKIIYDKTIKIKYNNFFPNHIVASLIAEMLMEKGFEIKLVAYSFEDHECSKIEDNTINLVLNYFEYIDNLYFYSSSYFMKIMKKDKFYCFLMLAYIKTGKMFLLKKLNKRFLSTKLKEPLVHIKSIYMVNEKTDDFSFLELNY